MAKIIVFGDIDITPLYISVDNCKELTISGKWPRCLNVWAGSHRIEATTITKFQRATRSPSHDIVNVMVNSMVDGSNTSIAGTIDIGDDEVLLIQVKQTVIKSKIFNSVVSVDEASQYIDMDTVINWEELAPGEKNKWAVFFCAYFWEFLEYTAFTRGKLVLGFCFC